MHWDKKISVWFSEIRSIPFIYFNSQVQPFGIKKDASCLKGFIGKRNINTKCNPGQKTSWFVRSYTGTNSDIFMTLKIFQLFECLTKC